jgi:hypothetical protein
MSARYRAAESVARDRKAPQVERREARIPDRKGVRHASGADENAQSPGRFAPRER